MNTAAGADAAGGLRRGPAGAVFFALVAVAILAWAALPASARADSKLNNAISVSAGAGQICAVKAIPPGTSSGQVYCWGRNDFGQVGDGTYDNRTVPVAVAGMNDARMVAANGDHTCTVRSGGTVFCWGQGNSGQLGDGLTGSHTSSVPVQVKGPGGTGFLTNVSTVTTGQSHTCAIQNTGQALCWGTVGGLYPTIVSGLSDAAAISAGSNYTCAVRNSGQAVCWGINNKGQLGDGTNTNRAVPTPVKDTDGTSDFSDAGSISASVTDGGSHTCATRTNGRVLCWGKNSQGQLGDGTTGDRSVPVEVKDIGGTGVLTGALEIGTGYSHSCVVRDSEDVACWGDNSRAQLGDGTIVNRLTPVLVQKSASGGPVQDATLLAAGGFNSCVTNYPSGVISCWGNNFYGSIGRDIRSGHYIPVPLPDLPGARAIATADSHSCAVRISGEAVCWGDNESGQIGDGTQENRLSPTPVSGLGNAKAVSAASDYSCGIRGGGQAVCWGSNAEYQLGTGGTANSTVPVDVSGLNDTLAITTGTSTEDHFTCAVRGSGQAVCWGANQLGLPSGDPDYVTTPTPIPGLANAKAISAGYDHACAIRISGQAVCIGSGGDGRLGNGSEGGSYGGVTSVIGLNSARSISAGRNHSCAVRTSGQAVCWGGNTEGQIGDGTKVKRLTPVVVTGLSDARMIAAGDSHSCAIRNSGQVACWGANHSGQLGDGTTTERLTPVTVPGISDARVISASGLSTCVIRATGQVLCWGSGYMGNGTPRDGSLFPVDVAAPGSHHLRVARGGNGRGRVVSVPAGIDCGSACVDPFVSGTAVTLTATPDPGFLFTGWAGGPCPGGGMANCFLIMNQDRAVTANFGPDPANPLLSVYKPGRGQGTVTSGPSGINCGSTCEKTFPKDTVVTLTATAAGGSVFMGWNGACEGTSATCRVTLAKAEAVQALFSPYDPDHPPLAVFKTGDGEGTVLSTPSRISCDPDCEATFDRDTVVTLDPITDSSSVFLGWNGACQGTGECEVKMSKARSVWASFAFYDPANPTLQVHRTGDGSGTVSSNPPGIDCGSTCAKRFPQNSTVTLTATAGPGSIFMGWNGDCAGAATTCTVKMDRVRAVWANFSVDDPANPALVVFRTGEGEGTVTSNPAGIECGPDCQARFAKDTVVTLTATADPGSAFTGWNGACTGTGPCKVKMSKARTVWATFAASTGPDSPRLAVFKSGDGEGRVVSSPAGIDCGDTCTATFDVNRVITLIATPESGSLFMGWNGACEGQSSTCKVKLSQSRSVWAHFSADDPANPALVVFRTGDGEGMVSSDPAGIECGPDCQARFAKDTVVTLTATAESGSLFMGWNGACEGASATCVVKLDRARSVWANFSVDDPANPALVVFRTGEGEGTVTSNPAGIECGPDCQARFAKDTVVTLTATAASGSVFMGWNGACTGTSPTCEVTMNKARSVWASFASHEPSNPPLAVFKAGNGQGTVVSLPPGIECGATCLASFGKDTVVTLTASPAPGSVFAGWSGACGGTGTCQVTMDQARSVWAAFTSFNPDRPPLVLFKTGSGSGVVASSPAGIECRGSGEICQAEFDKGTLVTLTATAASGSGFVGWGGDCSGSGNTCQVKMDALRSVWAQFTSQPAAKKARFGPLRLKPRKRTVKRGRQAVITARVKNVGDADATGVKLCLKAPKKLARVLKRAVAKKTGKKRKRVRVKRNGCVTLGVLPAGKTAIVKYRVKFPKKAKKAKLRFRAVGKGMARKNAVARIRVR